MFDSNVNNTYGGMQFNPQAGAQQYQVKRGSTLSQEEYARLVKNSNPFSLALTETEVLKGICNHQKPDGSGDALVQDPDGTIRCEICQYRFNPVSDLTKDDVTEACNLVNDILQTIKLLYIDMPINASREFYQIIPLIDKVPQLFDIAVKNFSKHENFNVWGYRGQNMGTMNLFNMLAGALNGTGPMPMGQPMYNPGMTGTMGQPMYNAPAGTPVGAVPPMSNGFGYPNGAPMPMGQPMYNPQTQGYQYVAGQQPVQPYQVATPPVQPAAGGQAPTDTAAQTDGQQVTAQATFKA